MWGEGWADMGKPGKDNARDEKDNRREGNGNGKWEMGKMKSTGRPVGFLWTWVDIWIG
jgi:hypothetical protein